MRKIFLILLVTQVCISGFSQNSHTSRRAEKRKRISTRIKQEEEGVIVFHHQFIFGGKLSTDGYGAFLEYGKSKSTKTAILYQFELGERKSPKEERQAIPLVEYTGQPIIYGKENFFYPLKLGIQIQTLLGNKSNKNGVSITANYGGGIALALVRPYFVQVNKNSKITYVRYQSPDSSLFLNNFVGGPGFGTGWDKITVTPGIFTKGALRFDYGVYNEIVSAVEVGLTGEFYTKKIPIMVHNPAKQFFLSAYVAIIFGRRR